MLVRIVVFCFVVMPFLLKAQWQENLLPFQASFRSMAVPEKDVIWAGGSSNTIIRSVDGAKTWQKFEVSPNQKLDFRGIYAFDRKTAIAMSAGLAEEGSAVIVRTSDGGQTWNTVFETNQTGVFLDGIHFVNSKKGFVIGDPQNGKVYMLMTIDGGVSWSRVEEARFPDVFTTEASFAASNSSLTSFKKHIWYAFQSRILYSSNAGKTWSIKDSGFPSGETSGIFGMNFKSKKEGVIVGGDYVNDKEKQVNIAFTKDSGANWRFSSIEPEGLKESAVFIGSKWLVVGTSGSSFYQTDGQSIALGKLPFHVVKCADHHCYAIGPKGNFGQMIVK